MNNTILYDILMIGTFKLLVLIINRVTHCELSPLASKGQRYQEYIEQSRLPFPLPHYWNTCLSSEFGGQGKLFYSVENEATILYK